MVIMFNYLNPHSNICIVDNKVQICKLKDYKGEYDQGIAAQVDSNNIVGLFVEKENLYFVKNNEILNITNEEISCNNVRKGNHRFFEFKVKNQVILKKEYEVTCSMEDLILGDDEEDMDFLLYLSDILSSKDNIKKFMMGHAIQK